ncbi:HAD family phosphatase [Phycicoccus endophyticus]|uniref:HAD family phosphatase n=1 Tax=Phycicoccus endophyticus TaxID=1690220 RepID=A0A7G9R1B5_9MICO|nr:HAD family hydrolase [Phycicoccus endophyticus]NHI18832.1 HAD family phosphatase [Phycicoccus endophyticus]QNN49390.1 HAD family phosphatase [Phycicoccus endophyticus]GGL36176.1 haloacid dehalogenase [Phycicoccus endophyticus]
MSASHLVCLDIDGTTVDHDGELHEPVREAVRAVVDAGHRVVLATGRGVLGTLPVLDALGLLDGYAVCANGAITLGLDPRLDDGYEVLDAVTFDPAPALRVLREEFPAALVAVEELGVGFKVSAPFPDGELEGTPEVVPFEELMAHPVTRLTIRDPESTSEAFLAGTDRIGLHGVEYAVGWSAWLDITPEGVSKAAALEAVRRRLGFEPSATLAVGDQRNDLEMLRWAARGVAMGNAPDEVKAAADEVTGHVDDDGLVAVLRSLP